MIESRADVLKQIGFKLDKKENTEGNAESNNDYYFYRGHSSKEYQITPYLFRDDIEEYDSYHYFMQNHSNEFIGLKPLEILSKLQHYEKPTRLMDVSRNPLVAAYFSVSGFGKVLDNKDENKTPEVIEFKLQGEDIKKFDSDTAKLLSHLPFLKPNEVDSLRASAIGSILINYFVENLILVIPQLRYKNYNDYCIELYELYKKPFSCEREIGDRYQISEDIAKKYERENIKLINNSLKLLFEFLIECMNHYSENKHNKLHKILLKPNDLKDSQLNGFIGSGRHLWRIDLDKIKNYFVDFQIPDEDISFIISTCIDLNKLNDKNNKIRFEYIFITSKNYTELYYWLKLNEINSNYYITEYFNEQKFWNNKFLNDSFFNLEKNNKYISSSMILLQNQITQNYPTFTPTAKSIDLLNGVFVNTCVTTDRMRAQQGAFMLFGLSRFWNIRRCSDFLYNSLRQFLVKDKNKFRNEAIDDINYDIWVKKHPDDSINKMKKKRLKDITDLMRFVKKYHLNKIIFNKNLLFILHKRKEIKFEIKSNRFFFDFSYIEEKEIERVRIRYIDSEIHKLIINFLVNNEPIRKTDGSDCDFFQKYKINSYEFEDYVFNARRFVASNFIEEKQKIIDRLDYLGINEQTLGCSIDNSYNYLKYKMQRKQN